jgi:hypothetical protein
LSPELFDDDHWSLIPELFDNDCDGEKQALDQALDDLRPWLTAMAPRKFPKLVTAIRQYVPDRFQKSVLRRYLEYFQTIRDAPDDDRRVEIVAELLDRAIENVRVVFRPDYPLYS